MEALVEVMEAEKLVPLFDIPAEMRDYQVEVTIRPIGTRQAQSGIAGETTSERIRKFREKYTHERFIEHLKQKVAEGFKFDFDVQKLIDGTETEEDIQARYRSEKRAWSDAVAVEEGQKVHGLHGLAQIKEIALWL